jgi:Integrase core domain
MKVLFVFILLSQQIVEAFADRHGIYSNDVRRRIASLHMEEILTAPRSPWQNPYAERLIGSIRRECLNHFVILNARHLRRTLASYFAYYHGSRTHLGLAKQCPFLGRSRVSEGSLRSHNSAACITVTNALQRNDMWPYAILANDIVCGHEFSVYRFIAAHTSPLHSAQAVSIFNAPCVCNRCALQCSS